jgi:hypothetical protein
MNADKLSLTIIVVQASRLHFQQGAGETPAPQYKYYPRSSAFIRGLKSSLPRRSV